MKAIADWKYVSWHGPAVPIEYPEPTDSACCGVVIAWALAPKRPEPLEIVALIQAILRSFKRALHVRARTQAARYSLDTDQRSQDHRSLALTRIHGNMSVKRVWTTTRLSHARALVI